MKKLAITLFAMLAVASTAFAANQVRISQVGPGGGGSTGTYVYDYVELFNSGGTSVNIGGWVVEYGAATGNWGSSAGNYFTIPANTVIAPCSYLLIQCGAAGTAGTALPVTPDFTTGNMSMSATNGKVALFNALNANVACGSETAGSIVDKVAWGTGNCPEGTATAALTAPFGLVRNNGGLADTDNNAADFTVVSAPVPHNSGSAQNAQCLATPSMKSTWGTLKTLYR